jgi:PAS domain S-box-containing protein
MVYQISLINGNCNYINKASFKTTGYSPSDFYNNPKLIKKILHPDWHEFFSNEKSKILEGKIPDFYEFQIIHKSGEIICIKQRNFILFDQNRPIAFAGVINDAKPLKEDNEIIRNQKKYAQIYENMSDVVWTLDINTGFFNYVSPSVYNLRGYTPEEVLKQNMGDVMTEESIQKINKTLQSKMERFLKGERKIEIYEVDQIHKDGSIIPTEVATKFLVDKNGHPKEVLGVSRDISYRKNAENELKAHAHSLEILNKIIKLTNKSNNIENLLNSVLTAILDLMNFKYGSIFLIDHERRVACPQVMIRVPEELKNHYQEISIDDESYQEIFVDGKSFIEGNFAEFSPEISEKWNCRSIVRIPLLHKDQVFGAFSLASEDINCLSPRDKAVLKSVGRELGTAIWRIQAEEKIKSSLVEKDFLLREIHHRVKNNLQIISSLINLQSLHLKDPSAIQVLMDSQNRVKSLARVHEILYKSQDIGKIDLKEYLDMLITNLSESLLLNNVLIKIDAQCEKLELNIDTAIPMGLIITELVTNSIKHAFPPGKSGMIYINIHSSDKENLILKVADNGVGIDENVNLETPEKLGLKLVNTLVKQLDGTIKIYKSPNTTFEIELWELKYKKRI